MERQLSLADTNPEYQAFVDKFKPKLTTDDCYTPDIIYEAVKDYAVEYYGLHGAEIIRPFWPGGDYLRESYPEGCVVIDNPPFSILSRIVKDYNAMGVKYFMFSPYLSALNTRDCTKVITGESIVYENGANVGTAFVANLEPENEARADSRLREIIRAANAENQRRIKKPPQPRYVYPDCVATSANLGYMAQHGTDFTIKKADCYFIRALDSQKAAGKSIFGAGLLLSRQAAEEKARAERAAAMNAAIEKAAPNSQAVTIWELSDRERELQKVLGNGAV